MPKKQKQTSGQRYDQFLRETQQLQENQTDWLYRAALTELIDGGMPPSGDADRRINRAVIAAIVDQYADQIAERFARHVEDVVRFDPEGQRNPLREVFRPNGTD
jgi:hypothetical protein